MIRKFENFKDLSDFISEEISLGNTKPFPIKNRLYKSGDYICSSFMIDDREVVVSSIVIPSSDIKLIKGSRNYKTLSDYLKQFGVKTDYYLYIGFMEFKDGRYFKFENVNDNTTLFRKMETIVGLIKEFVDYHKVKYVIYNSVENDLGSGLVVDYNKRDKFYEIYLTHNNITYKKISHQIDVDGEIISGFYFLDLTK